MKKHDFTKMLQLMMIVVVCQTQEMEFHHIFKHRGEIWKYDMWQSVVGSVILWKLIKLISKTKVYKSMLILNTFLNIIMWGWGLEAAQWLKELKSSWNFTKNKDLQNAIKGSLACQWASLVLSLQHTWSWLWFILF